MFNAQNEIIDMDMRHDITDLSVSGTALEKQLIGVYATSIENFIAFVTGNPGKVARVIEILKKAGDGPSQSSE